MTTIPTPPGADVPLLPSQIQDGLQDPLPQHRALIQPFLIGNVTMDSNPSPAPVVSVMLLGMTVTQWWLGRCLVRRASRSSAGFSFSFFVLAATKREKV